jgi:hypothetical protein
MILGKQLKKHVSKTTFYIWLGVVAFLLVIGFLLSLYK